MPSEIGGRKADTATGPEILLSAATARHRAGDLRGAEQLYRDVLRSWPGQLDAQHLLGVVVGRRGDLTQAERLLRTALRRAPERPHFLGNLANLLRRTGRNGEALCLYARALRLDPKAADLHANQAGALLAAGLHRAAETAARRALAIDPEHPTALVNLGGALVGQLRFDAAAAPLDTAVGRGVDSYDLWLNLGHRHLGLGETADAIAAFRRALEREPGSLEALRWLGMSLARGREMSEARRLLEHYLKRCPEPSSAMAMLGHLEMLDGHHARGAALMRRALERPGSGSAEHSTLVFDLNYDPDLDPDALIAEHRLWAHRHTPAPPPPRPAVIDPDPTRRLRIGLLSPDLRAHAVAFFLAPILEHLPRDQFEIVAYANVQRPDGVTERLKTLCDRWEDIWRCDDPEVARRMRGDRLDILLDLAGHTADSRLALCGLRLAPLQVTYLGYPNTTGLTQMDWRLVDRWTDPPELPWRGTERLWRLDRCFLAFDPSHAPEVAPPPCETAGTLTFGSFNNLAKVNHRVVALWSRVLAAVPRARLLLKHDVSHDPEVQDRVRGSFAEHGIAPERIAFLPRTSAYHEHLAAYAEVDIALDPFPYNGTTTTCEALWMGVPVVALAGTTHAGRVGASLLRAVGLEATLARDPDDYVATAVELARTPAMLRVLRGMLRPTMAGSELLDHRGHAEAVADALRGMWRDLLTECSDGAATWSRQILPSGSVEAVSRS